MRLLHISTCDLFLKGDCVWKSHFELVFGHDEMEDSTPAHPMSLNFKVWKHNSVILKYRSPPTMHKPYARIGHSILPSHVVPSCANHWVKHNRTTQNTFMYSCYNTTGVEFSDRRIKQDAAMKSLPIHLQKSQHSGSKMPPAIPDIIQMFQTLATCLCLMPLLIHISHLKTNVQNNVKRMQN